MLTVSPERAAELGLVRAHRTHVAVLDWLRAQSGIVLYHVDGWEHDAGARLFQEVHRQGLLLRYMAFRWDALELGRRTEWHPWIRWSTRRYFGRRATPSEQASLPRTLASLQRRDLIERRRSNPGRAKTTALRLTTRGVDALHAIAAAQGAMISTKTVRYSRRLREVAYMVHALDPKWDSSAPDSPEGRHRYSSRLRSFLYRHYDEEARALAKLGVRQPVGAPAPPMSTEWALERLRLGPLVDADIEFKLLEGELDLMVP